MITVAKLMKQNLVFGRVDESIQTVVGRMSRYKCNQLPILDNSELVGIVVERDIREVMQTPLFYEGTAVSIMTRHPITISPDAPATEAAKILNAYQFSALPVVENGRLVGIITVNDFVQTHEIAKRKMARR